MFFLIRSTNEYEKGWFSCLGLDVDPDEDELLQIVKFLESEGFSPTSVRELSRQKDLAYSFVDGTPGHTTEHICLIVDVDVHDTLPQPDPKQEEERLFVSFEEYLRCYEDSDGPYQPEVLMAALTKLVSENS